MATATNPYYYDCVGDSMTFSSIANYLGQTIKIPDLLSIQATTQDGSLTTSTNTQQYSTLQWYVPQQAYINVDQQRRIEQLEKEKEAKKIDNRKKLENIISYYYKR